MATRKTTKTPTERLQRAFEKGEQVRDPLRQAFERLGVKLPELSAAKKRAIRASVHREVTAANAEAAAEVEREVERRVSTRAHDHRLLREREVEQLVGLKRTALWRLEREKKFPARVKVGKRAVRWRESDVRAWIASRKA